MATTRSYINCLETTREIAFFCIWWLKFCNLYMKQFSRVLSSGVALSKETMFLTILQNSQKNVFSGVSFLTKLPAGSLRPLEAATEDVL